jgi:hyperosmotically inducible periplasmic protein
MKNIKIWVGGLSCGLALLFAGCASDGNNRSTGEVIDDTAILTKAKAALVNDPVVSGMAIDVDVDRGVVSLNGAVNGPTEKQKAEEVARGVEGVKAVRNNLVVRPADTKVEVKTEVNTK